MVFSMMARDGSEEDRSTKAAKKPEEEENQNVNAAAHPDPGVTQTLANALHRMKMPAGDPSMAEEVRIAKRAKHKIGDEANVRFWKKLCAVHRSENLEF